MNTALNYKGTINMNNSILTSELCSALLALLYCGKLDKSSSIPVQTSFTFADQEQQEQTSSPLNDIGSYTPEELEDLFNQYLKDSQIQALDASWKNVQAKDCYIFDHKLAQALNLSGDAVFLLQKIVTFANSKHIADCTLGNLADILNVSIRKINYILNRLKEMNILAVIARPGKSNLFKVNFELIGKKLFSFWGKTLLSFCLKKKEEEELVDQAFQAQESWGENGEKIELNNGVSCVNNKKNVEFLQTKTTEDITRNKCVNILDENYTPAKLGNQAQSFEVSQEFDFPGQQDTSFNQENPEKQEQDDFCYKLKDFFEVSQEFDAPRQQDISFNQENQAKLQYLDPLLDLEERILRQSENQTKQEEATQKVDCQNQQKVSSSFYDASNLTVWPKTQQDTNSQNLQKDKATDYLLKRVNKSKVKFNNHSLTDIVCDKHCIQDKSVIDWVLNNCEQLFAGNLSNQTVATFVKEKGFLAEDYLACSALFFCYNQIEDDFYFDFSEKIMPFIFNKYKEQENFLQNRNLSYFLDNCFNEINLTSLKRESSSFAHSFNDDDTGALQFYQSWSLKDDISYFLRSSKLFDNSQQSKKDFFRCMSCFFLNELYTLCSYDLKKQGYTKCIISLQALETKTEYIYNSVIKLYQQRKFFRGKSKARVSDIPLICKEFLHKLLGHYQASNGYSI